MKTTGNTVLITGGGSGIGLALAEELAGGPDGFPSGSREGQETFIGICHGLMS